MKKTSIIFILFLVNVTAWLDPFILSYLKGTISTAYRFDPLFGFLFMAYMVWGILLYYGMEEMPQLMLQRLTKQLLDTGLMLLNLLAAIVIWAAWYNISTLAVVLTGIYACRIINGSFLDRSKESQRNEKPDVY